MSTLKYAVVLLALVAMAWPSAPPKAKPSLAGSEWRLVEIEGAKVSGPGTLRFTQTSIRGKAPCNAFFGAFRETEGQIMIAGINATRMLCAGRMDVERAFLDGLARARSYLIEGGRLMLLDGAGQAVMKLSG